MINKIKNYIKVHNNPSKIGKTNYGGIFNESK